MVREVFDEEALRPDAGIRAIWLLYKRGQWGYLEDLGVERGVAGPAFAEFEKKHVVGPRLTKSQCRLLARTVPGLEEAGKELRLAYALKFYSKEANLGGERHESKDPKGKKEGMEVEVQKVAGPLKVYHGEVVTEQVSGSDLRAENLAAELSALVGRAGGRVDVGRNFGDAYAILVLTLPEGTPPPSFAGIEWRPVNAMRVPVVPDQGIRE